MNNKFCFIYGSFNENGFRRRSAGSDIDIICQNMDEYEVRRQLKKAFPKSDIDMNTVKIDISKADVKSEDNSEIIRAKMCYWQKCDFFELFNRDKIPYKFDCNENSNNNKNIGAHLRNPDKLAFVAYVNKDVIDAIGTKQDYTKSIEHYGRDNFDKALLGLDTDEKNLFKSLQSNKWKLNTSCQTLLGDFISVVKSTKTINGNNHKMSYDHFLTTCFIN